MYISIENRQEFVYFMCKVIGGAAKKKVLFARNCNIFMCQFNNNKKMFMNHKPRRTIPVQNRPQ